jgi:23S rRNA (cytidine1920-2'-O)/16S rRNA (cytidine1409-2'-O)-methyltransferase
VSADGVLVSGALATKPARLVDDGEPIELLAEPPVYVSRGGMKLAGALDVFEIEPNGKRCLDVGSSAGGFTDCLLQRGASGVLSVDVGRGQLHWSLRNDSRVTVREETDVRDLEPAYVGEVGLVVADLSFISLRTVMRALARVAGTADLVLLVKPQFEVGRGRVGKGGLVRDPALHEEAVAGVLLAAGEWGLEMLGRCESPIAGATGNKEFFVHLRRR